MRILSFDVGIKNLAYALLLAEPVEEGSKEVSLVIEDWGILPLLEQCKPPPTIETICASVLEKMRTTFPREKYERIDHVVIENQPALKNPIMKTIQVVISSFFCFSRGPLATDPTVGTVKLVGANGKLKLRVFSQRVETDVTPSISGREDATTPTLVLQPSPVPKKEKGKAKSSYKNNKALSIDLTREFLPMCMNAEEASVLLERQKKKDDMGDAFLQALYYLHEHLHYQLPFMTTHRP